MYSNPIQSAAATSQLSQSERWELVEFVFSETILWTHGSQTRDLEYCTGTQYSSARVDSAGSSVHW